MDQRILESQFGGSAGGWSNRFLDQRRLESPFCGSAEGWSNRFVDQGRLESPLYVSARCICSKTFIAALCLVNECEKAKKEEDGHGKNIGDAQTRLYLSS